MKLPDKKLIMLLWLPSIFFIVIFFTQTFFSSVFAVNLIAGGVLLLLIANLVFRNIIISKILGIVFLLGSLYFLLALLDDVFDGEASIGYLFGGFIILFSIAMSVLLMVGYDKKLSY
ncbi:MAG: hypothetical protein A2X17_07130 [Bacteroidetes bacterium GWF2_41_61]|nr:MAG: hypothetical protein A2X20_05135 [Bacteroidetes bacterium GWE2_40_15]OFY27818.1 MAG: hypothetical protein A2X17_07130 [Bacteroidetes bacterium GWF2_41_61]OFY91497.1 MAG: hypothetical protein A2266_05825 [Bacteroidetes bacterium RIFOXYA12_FULL_40_10]HBG23890.1 hypothetical protein [Rikenellaceae bacterium]HBZ25453.1 hypothetical protein [Rikenellaceae bacterium]